MLTGTETDISIHALREEGDVTADGDKVDKAISIHALREEDDHPLSVFLFSRVEFLSTPSVRRATWAITPCQQSDRISIHALREEGDENLDYSPECSRNFYPRPP